MKVVTVTSNYPPDTGGIVTVVDETTRQLANMGHDVTVLVLGQTGQGDETVSGVQVIRRPHRGPGGWAPGLRRTWRSLRRYWADADLIHVHGYHTILGPQVVRLARRTHPVSWSTHFHGHGHRGLTRLAWPVHDFIAGHLLQSRGVYIHAVSHFEAGRLQERHGVVANVIPNGVASIAVERSGGPRSGILFVGFLERYKGVHHVIAALPQTNQTLTIVGDGPERNRLEQQARHLGVADRVHFLGRVDHAHLQELMQQAEALILPSQAEAYGVVVAEALAAGTPAIVHDATALSEFTEIPGVIGLDDLTPETIAAAMDGPKPSVDLTGQDKVLTWQEVARRYEAWYETILQAHHATPRPDGATG